ncbi:hypothetical protein JTE90_027061 [Oedothorax gibbosus]|uniref:Uncharacterized protein n=1 Tax=Oedothorax gibbosus TaxID=931172 RepID=A0AAV6TSV5_9ARAC|nr:hypothetical protein JTE90_027061 [Oedothorax gibbosus]
MGDQGIKSTELHKKHNPDPLPSNSCHKMKKIMDQLMPKLSIGDNSVEKLVYNICKQFSAFMSKYTKNPLSFGTQNIIVGEFFAPLVDIILQNKEIISTSIGSPNNEFKRSMSLSDNKRRESQSYLEAAYKKIKEMEFLNQTNLDTFRKDSAILKERIIRNEQQINNLTNAQTEFLKNAVKLDVTTGKLEETYQKRQQELEGMKRQMIDLFDNEEAHLDRVLKKTTESHQIQNDALAKTVNDLGEIGINLATTASTFQEEVATVKNLPTVAQPVQPWATKSTPPQLPGHDQVHTVLIDRPEGSSNNLEHFKKLLMEATISSATSFKYIAIYCTTTGFKSNAPSEEQSKIVCFFKDSPSFAKLQSQST